MPAAGPGHGPRGRHPARPGRRAEPAGHARGMCWRRASRTSPAGLNRCLSSTTVSTCSTQCATAVAALLDGCPQLTVLTTSREPLGLAGECASRLAPLPVPPGRRGRSGPWSACRRWLSSSDRAARVRPGFPPRMLLSPAARRRDRASPRRDAAGDRAGGRAVVHVLPRRAGRPGCSARSTCSAAPARPPRRPNRTLRATIDWSYRLLPEPPSSGCPATSPSSPTASTSPPPRRSRPPGADGDPARALAHLVDASMIDAITGAGRHPLPHVFGDAACLRPRPAGRVTGEQDAAVQQFAGLGPDLTGWIDATVNRARRAAKPTRRCAANCPTCGAARPAARTLDRRSTAAAAMVAARLHEAVVWRDLIEISAPGPKNSRVQPGIPARPCWRPPGAGGLQHCAGTPTPPPKRARACLDPPATTPSRWWHGLRTLAPADLARGEFADR